MKIRTYALITFFLLFSHLSWSNLSGDAKVKANEQNKNKIISFPLADTSYLGKYQADTVLLLMGSRYEVYAIHENETLARKAILAGISEIQRIEKLISSWDPNSQTSMINKNAGIKPVAVDRELYDLIYRCKKVSELTDGAFDISFGPLGSLWDINQPHTQIPEQTTIDSALLLVNYQDIIMDTAQQTVFLKQKGMKIGFGAIGKGYSANRAKQVMQTMGIKDGLVNAGGDLTAWGKTVAGEEWKIGIADPDKKEEYVGWLQINNSSVVTSGNYEKYIYIKGKKYTHIIDPKNGYPVEGLKSVTIISPDAELSDALATSVFVMGVQKGLNLINRLKNIECVMIDDKNDIYQSKGVNLNYY